MLISGDESVQVVYELRECLQAPIGLNEQVGTVYIYLNGECFRTFPILSKERVAKQDYLWFLKKIWKIFCL